MVLVGSDCGEPRLREDEGFELFSECRVCEFRFGRYVHHVEPGLVAMHRVQDDLQGVTSDGHCSQMCSGPMNRLECQKCWTNVSKVGCFLFEL